MNIFMVTSVPMTPPWDQGDKNLAYGLTRRLHDHHFSVLTQHDGPNPCGANLSLVPIFSSRHPSVFQKARVFLYLMQNTSNGAKSGPTGRYQDADLFHFIYKPTTGSSWLNRLIPAFRQRPTLHTIPALNAVEDKMRPGLFFTDQLVVLSGQAHDRLRQLGFNNVTHIPVGIDTIRWSGLRFRRPKMKARLGISAQPVLLYPGHYTPGYGTEVILEALPNLVGEIPDLRIIFACRMRSSGDKKRELAFKKKVASIGLSKHILFFNTVEDMQPLIAASDLTILPSETMRDKLDIPTTLLESLAARVPVVISDLPPMNELMGDAPAKDAFGQRNPRISEIGLAVPPGDPFALVEAITYILKDDVLRQRMGKNGEELIRERFNCMKTGKAYEKLYQELISWTS